MYSAEKITFEVFPMKHCERCFEISPSLAGETYSFGVLTIDRGRSYTRRLKFGRYEIMRVMMYEAFRGTNRGEVGLWGSPNADWRC